MPRCTMERGWHSCDRREKQAAHLRVRPFDTDRRSVLCRRDRLARLWALSVAAVGGIRRYGRDPDRSRAVFRVDRGGGVPPRPAASRTPGGGAREDEGG